MEKNLAGPGTIGHRGLPERGLVGLPARSIVLKRYDANTLYPVSAHCGSSPSAREGLAMAEAQRGADGQRELGVSRIWCRAAGDDRHARPWLPRRVLHCATEYLLRHGDRLWVPRSLQAPEGGGSEGLNHVAVSPPCTHFNSIRARDKDVGSHPPFAPPRSSIKALKALKNISESCTGSSSSSTPQIPGRGAFLRRRCSPRSPLHRTGRSDLLEGGKGAHSDSISRVDKRHGLCGVLPSPEGWPYHNSADKTCERSFRIEGLASANSRSTRSPPPLTEIL